MNNPNERSDLLREIAVIEYVSGSQSESKRRNFEKKLEQSPALREAVEAERRFLNDMRKAGDDNVETVSQSNFDVLLSTIEAQENNEAQQKKVIPIIGDHKKNLKQELAPASVNYWSGSHFAMAASAVIFAVVFMGLYVQYSSPKFETLSDTVASEEINLSKLAQETRVAKISFVENSLEQQIDDTLRRYKLRTFEAGAESNQRYVISESAISDIELRRWRDDALVQQVELFTGTQKR